MDREGNPSFNPILNPDGIKDRFNATDPVDDVKNYLQPLSETLQRHGYSPDDATAAARTLLPDILHYDRTMPAHYPNGRVMTDDVFSARMIFMVQGRPLPKTSNHTTICWPRSRSSGRRTPKAHGPPPPTAGPANAVPNDPGGPDDSGVGRRDTS
jgi:hypothetical protein